MLCLIQRIISNVEYIFLIHCNNNNKEDIIKKKKKV